MLNSLTRVDEDGERMRTRPKDWHPEYMMSKTHFKEYMPARSGDKRRVLRATIEPSPDDICSSDSEGNEASPVRHFRVHDGASLPTEKQKQFQSLQQQLVSQWTLPSLSNWSLKINTTRESSSQWWRWGWHSKRI
jgi:hypothetical protein